MIYDSDFLAKLDKQRNKVIYVKLISLNYNEEPLEAIEGRATSGSINIDGASAVRRTCQISLVTDTLNISDYYWTLKTKFKVQIGVENTVTDTPKIIWFDQGAYLINSFSTAYSSNSYTVNISGKDKMCMLNGELGGAIGASTVFDAYDEIDRNGSKKTIKNPIKQIIREIVHHYGGEPIHNIIINDLDIMGLELLEYRFEQPLYLLRISGNSNYSNATLDSSFGTPNISTLKRYDEFTIDGTFNDSEEVTKDGIVYNVAKIDFGETAGYREIDLVYPSDLISNIGETVTSVLDKIKNMLGDYEYFYDLDGRFVFQKKKTYLNTSWNPIAQNVDEQIYVDPYFASTPYSYNFSDSTLFTSFNNTPNLANLKNDFTVWGKNKNDLAIHMRYAIDTKPLYYKSITVDGAEVDAYNKKYNLNVAGQTSVIYWYKTKPADADKTSIECSDWREIIYQMQKDYYKYNHLDDFRLKVASANPNHYPSGTTGYEQYYVDIQGFWRYLYNPEKKKEWTHSVEYLKEEIGKLKEQISENPDNKDELEEQLNNFKDELDWRTVYYDADDSYPWWNKTIYEAPSNLLFWFDFLDTQSSDLGQYAVSQVGIRPKVTNDSGVKAIYYGDTPMIIFDDFSDGMQEKLNQGYKYFNMPSYYNMFIRSSQGKSAKEAIDTLLYNHTYCIESVSIQSIPIYYLQPNTLIHISDYKAGIEGDYIISKLTLPLAYNGTMSITGTKVVQRLY